MAWNFEDTDELTLLRESIREFALREIEPRAFELDKKEEFSIELTKQMGDLGLLGVLIDEKFGGQGLDSLSYIAIVEELAKVDGSQAATIAAHNSLGVKPIENFGTDAQKEKFLPPICSGHGLWGFGLTEAEAGSDARASKTVAVQDGSDWVIRGSKIWITNSACELTQGVTVQAVTGVDQKGRTELSCFLVPQDTPGFTAKPMKDKMMWRSSNTGELYFDEVRVPQENMLGKRGEGFSIMMQTLDSGRLSIGAMGLGLAKGAFQQTLKYVNERKTFGQTIGKHQAIGFKLAEMATRIEAAEGLLYKACWLKDNKKPYAKQAAMAKLYCSEVAEFCAREGQQTFGGYGLMKEYPIERFYRDAALLRIGEGTSEIQRLVIARAIGC